MMDQTRSVRAGCLRSGRRARHRCPQGWRFKSHQAHGEGDAPCGHHAQQERQRAADHNRKKEASPCRAFITLQCGEAEPLMDTLVWSQTNT
ncbi:hypothetical protein INR49_017979 [Caranx melampygus]|nr:hypothetical protein INR49_017979 [Caranx melampygus]